MFSLYNLAIRDFRVRNIFVQINAVPYLHFTHSALMHEHNARNDRSMLLSVCRQALVCTEDNILNTLVKDLSYMLDSSRCMDADCFAEACIRFNKLEDLGDSKYALASIARSDPMPNLYSSANISDGAVLIKSNSPTITRRWQVFIGLSSSTHS